MQPLPRQKQPQRLSRTTASEYLQGQRLHNASGQPAPAVAPMPSQPWGPRGSSTLPAGPAAGRLITMESPSQHRKAGSLCLGAARRPSAVKRPSFSVFQLRNALLPSSFTSHLVLRHAGSLPRPRPSISRARNRYFKTSKPYLQSLGRSQLSKIRKMTRKISIIHFQTMHLQ